MPRTGENIYKRKDGRWEGRYIKSRSPSGRAIYGYLYARTYRELKLKMNSVFLLQNEHKQTDSLTETVQFNMISYEWLDSKQPYIKESTFVKYRNLLKDYILPNIGNENIKTLDYEKLQSFCLFLLKEGSKKGTGLSAKTVSDIFSIVKGIMQYSSNKGDVPACNGKAIHIKQEPPNMRVLSNAEQDALIKYLLMFKNYRNLGLLLCLFTGLRIGEICALKWRDVSLENGTVFIHQTMQRIQLDEEKLGRKTKILISTPKSACSIRTIPLPCELIEILKKYEEPAEAYFLTGNPLKYIEPRTMQNYFKKVIADCSIEEANFHSLRHSFATRCVEAGFDVKSLSEILGHATVNITMNRYVHPSLDLKRENMNRLSNLFSVR